MNPKKIVATVLLIFVLASVGYLVLGGSSDKKPSSVIRTAEVATAPAMEHQTIVYYFHATKRCKTCLTIEAYAEEAVRDSFPEPLLTGDMEWRTVNLDEPENDHFLYDYQLASRTIVLVEQENGVDKKWERLDRTWELVHDKQKFVEYITEEIDAFLDDRNG